MSLFPEDREIPADALEEHLDMVTIRAVAGVTSS